MGERNPNPTSYPQTVPPGCRFYPSEQQLLCYYLPHKSSSNQDRPFLDPISTVDLYSHHPFDLPDTACFRFGRGGRRRHWYCYVAVDDRLRRRRRGGGGGYWRRRGRVRDVVGEGAGKVVVGTRKTFVYYLGEESSKSAVRTDWVMYEYALIDHHHHHQVSFVLCRVLVKLSRQCKGSDHILSSCGEESIATVRDIGIQHDGNNTSSIRETVLHDDDSVDKKEEVLGVKIGLDSGINDRSTARANAVAGVQLPSSLQPYQPVIDNLTAEQVLCILEEDYIELDDLTCPLSGVDFT